MQDSTRKTETCLRRQEVRRQSGQHAGGLGAQGRADHLGTWTQRQVHYKQLPAPSLPACIPGTPQAQAPSTGSKPKRRSPGEQRSNGGGAAALPGAGEYGAGANGGGGACGGGGGGGGGNAAETGVSRELSEAEARRTSQQGTGPSGRGEHGEEGTPVEDEEGLRQAAWRWRFNRRWAQEQARSWCLPQHCAPALAAAGHTDG